MQYLSTLEYVFVPHIEYKNEQIQNEKYKNEQTHKNDLAYVPYLLNNLLSLFYSFLVCMWWK